jgi:uncharacterized membrane protein
MPKGNLPSSGREPAIPALRRLLAAGALTAAETEALEARVRLALPWRAWLDRGLLGLGAALVLAGIVCFFAHNWDRLADAGKLGLAGGAILLSLGGATWAGFDRPAGKVLLAAAAALVGVFLAVFGQIYQTGADSWQLFATWALLITPWVALGRFMPLWIGWVALLNSAVGLYWPVARPPFDFFFVAGDNSVFREVTISLALVNGLALLARELAERRRQPWFDGGWSVHLLLAGLLAAASTETVGEIIRTWTYSSNGDIKPDAAFGAVAVNAALNCGLGFYYSRVRHSLPALALVTLSACAVLTFLVVRVLSINEQGVDPATLFLDGLVVLGVFGAGVAFLRAQRLAHRTI